MSKVLDGVKVVEAAEWWFVPSVGGLLADWGADVIHIEHPEYGDKLRGLRVGKTSEKGLAGGRSYMFEHANRGKRGIAVDLSMAEGRDLLMQLVASADVFMTSFLPEARQRFGIDVESIRQVNPNIIYVRGSGYGPKGPEFDKPGFDSAASWARAGMAHVLRTSTDSKPLTPRAAFGDSIAAMTLAGGVGLALYRRAATGQTSVVDASLLGSAMWVMTTDIIASKIYDVPELPLDSRYPGNPIYNSYQTADGRWIQLSMVQSDIYWPDVVTKMGHPELVDDPRFLTAELRGQNRDECIQTLKDIFASADLSHWRDQLASAKGVWAYMQSPRELHDDEQVIANHYIEYLDLDGSEMPIVTAPVQFDEVQHNVTRAPLHGEHTDEVLQQELGLTMERLIELKMLGAIN